MHSAAFVHAVEWLRVSPQVRKDKEELGQPLSRFVNPSKTS